MDSAALAALRAFLKTLATSGYWRNCWVLEAFCYIANDFIGEVPLYFISFSLGSDFGLDIDFVLVDYFFIIGTFLLKV